MNRAQKRLTVICLIPFVILGAIAGTTGSGDDIRFGLTGCGLIVVIYVALFFVFKQEKK